MKDSCIYHKLTHLIVTPALTISILLVLSACEPSPNGSIDETTIKTNSHDNIVADQTGLIAPETPSSELTEKPTSTVELFDKFEFATIDDARDQTKKENRGEPYCLAKESSAKSSISIPQACQKISKRLASVSLDNCTSAKLIFSQCLSVNEFPILFSEFSPTENKSPQGRILVIGGIHGDELTSVSMIFRWIEKLNKRHSGLFHWHLVPMMNPDGVLKRAASRTNKNGVDLNRNLPSTDWEEKALIYWKEKTNENARKYPGKYASSEPETKWLIDEINSFKPDAIISVHAPYGIVDFDAHSLNTAPKNLGRLHLNLLGTYPGSLGNYAGINRDIPVITLELPHAWQMPSTTETTRIWEDIISWLRKNINQLQSPK